MLQATLLTHLEPLHVALSYALGHPRAVVVQLVDAHLAIVAVRGEGTLVYLALLAKAPVTELRLICRNVGGYLSGTMHDSRVLCRDDVKANLREKLAQEHPATFQRTSPT